ncbi:LbtU family siderophore porin [Thiohalomonas denitrificans]|uniref:Phosphate-selective porin O and P n=1 Tax=Thiohalomonas denitrificans TaxID=415747 RepID=A0A1G5Q6R4_9GAMM|nr:LbtU family siderophore porin [Thiohalomonas denitrificans]SCZ57544.1 Phosphate-selective porin O and P [Thiohalomonas denitrificans]
MSRHVFEKVALVAAVSATWGMAQAQESELRDTVRYLEGRVQVLEEEKVVREEAVKAASPINFGALIEVEGAGGEDHEGADSSDVVLATVELVAEAQINDWTHAQVAYLFEEDDTEPGEIDQAILTFGNPERSPFYLSGGRMYVPFGVFESGMVSDPLTLELGETRESALQVGFETGGLYGAAYAFNGDSQEVGDDTDSIDQFGANLGWAMERDGYILDVGLGYISSVADSDGVSGAMGEIDRDEDGVADVDIDSLQDAVPGISAHAIVNTGSWTFIGEYTGASDDFQAADMGFRGNGAQPTAWNLEANYGFMVMGRDVSVGVARQESAEAVELGLPESKTLAALSMGIMDNTALSLEYALAEDYSMADGGSGEDGGIFTLQMAAEF